MSSKVKVAVLYGGRSGEHEISIRSAKSILAALDPAKYEVSEYFISKEGKWEGGRMIRPEPGGNPGVDVVFPVLHGTFGEDGTMQGLLELADLPYVGPAVLGSAVAMDKDLFKRVMAASGIPVVDFATVARQDVETAVINLPYPLFVKPANLGSSVGISKVRNEGELRVALREAAKYDWKVVVERGITGREFECSVIGNEEAEASMPCEILPSREFYDYEDKYLLDKAVIEMPAKLDAAKTEELRALAVKCFQACGCEGMSRVDFLMETSTGKLFVNELNTIPGFTSISMYPKMWEHSGLPYGQLLDRLIGLAMARQARKKATRYTRE